MTLELLAEHMQAHGERIGVGADGSWAVAKPWELGFPHAGGWHTVPSAEPLRGAVRVEADRIWAGAQALDRESLEWMALPRLGGLQGFNILDTAWVDERRLALAATAEGPSKIAGHASDPTPAERLQVLDALTREVDAVVWDGDASRDTRRLAAAAGTLVAAGDGVRAWSPPYEQAHEVIGSTAMHARALDISADGLLIAVAGLAGDALLCSPESDLHRPLAGTDSTAALALGREQVAVGNRQAVLLFSIDGERLAELAVPRPVVDLAFDPAGDRLLVLLEDRALELSTKGSPAR